MVSLSICASIVTIGAKKLASVLHIKFTNVFHRKLETETVNIQSLLKYFGEQKLISTRKLVELAWLREGKVFKAEYLQKSKLGASLAESSKPDVYKFLIAFPEF